MRSALGSPLANDRPPSPAEEEIHLLQYWQVVLRRRRLALAVALGFAALAGLWALQGRDTYRATSQLLIEREDPAILNFRRITEVNERGWSDEFFQTQHRMVRSRAVAVDAIRRLDLLQHPEFGGPRDPREVEAALNAEPGQSRPLEAAVRRLQARLDVEWLRGTRLIAVSYVAHDPQLAARVANDVPEAYIRVLVESRRRAAADAVTWLAEQIEAQHRRIAAAEAALQATRDKERLIEGIVNVDDRRTLIEQRLRDLATARNQARTRRLEREALARQMNEAASPLELPDVQRNPVVSQLRIELANLERRVVFLQEKYLDEHPEVRRVRSQIDDGRRKIAAEAQQMIRAAENDFKAAAAQETSLEQALEEAKSAYSDLSRRTLEYDVSRRDLEAAKTVLAGLTTRLKETDVSQELRSVYARVLDKAAQPRRPSGPRRGLKLLLGTLFGIAAAIGLVIALDAMDDTVRTPADVRQRLQLPLLTVVPDAPARNGVALLEGVGGDAFVEPWRLLRANLQHTLGGEETGQAVLVTSTGPGEGKTLNAVNLALSLARQGCRVLLVDADLRQAAAGRLLDCARGPGLAELLAGRVPVSEAIRTAGPLDVLPAGGSGGEDLVSARALKPLLLALRASYDWVVLDAPPVGPVADALVMAPLADVTVLVVQAERVPLRAAVQTAERLAQAGARMLGVVLNRAPVERYPYEYSFHYGRYERPPALGANGQDEAPSLADAGR